MCDIETLRLFISERLSAVADDILAVFVRTIVQYQQQIDEQHRQLAKFLTPQISSDHLTPGFPPVCEEEKSPEHREERRRETDPPLASTPNGHREAQADVENYGASQQLTVALKHNYSHRSESDTVNSEDWEQTTEDLSQLDQSHGAERVYLRNEISGRQSLSTTAHAMEKIFSCTFCFKTFTRKGDAKRHEIVHTGEKPFACTVCGKRFARNSHLKYHHTHIHIEQKRSAISCTRCGKTFRRKYLLENHERAHRLSCVLCRKRFKSVPLLKKHVETHSMQEKSLLQSHSEPTTVRNASRAGHSRHSRRLAGGASGVCHLSLI